MLNERTRVKAGHLAHYAIEQSIKAKARIHISWDETPYDALTIVVRRRVGQTLHGATLVIDLLELDAAYTYGPFYTRIDDLLQSVSDAANDPAKRTPHSV